MAAMRPVELSDSRVLLRLPAAEDLVSIESACQDAELQRWIEIPVPYGREHAEGWVAGAGPAWEEDAELRFALVDRSDGSFAGALSLHAREAGMREIGYWTAPWARGRGLTTAGVRLVARWGLRELGLRRVEWLAGVGNIGSRRVAERAGFVVEGVLRGRLAHRGEVRDAWVGGLVPGDLEGPATARDSR
jgi:RimJ/RimL family protein N-acetyltransferase